MLCFFRGHNPEKSGDDKSGKSTIQSALNGQSISGIATGSSGLAVRAFVPINHNGDTIGTMQVGFGDSLFETYNRISTETVDLFSSDGLVYSTSESHESWYGNAIDTFDDASNIDFAFKGEELFVKSQDELVLYHPVLDPTQDVIVGVFRIAYDMSSINALVRQTVIVNSLLVLLIISIIIFVNINFKKNITNPINEFATILDKMSNNDYTTSKLDNAHSLKKADETGKLARSITKLTETFHEIINSLKDSSTSIFDKSDSLSRSSGTGEATIKEINEGFNAFSLGIQEQANDVNLSVESMHALSTVIETSIEISNEIHSGTATIEENYKTSDTKLKNYD